LDATEDDLFRFRRIVAGDDALRHALADATAPTDSRLALANALLAGKVTAHTNRLVEEAIRHPRGSILDDTLERFGRLAAARRAQLIARVRSAVTLTDEQQRRLAAALGRLYGHDIVLDVEVDPAVLGGLEIAIGDEVIDGTVLARLDEARRRLAH
jgi:F-type H+-transporting ATPase subunit delta